MDRTVTISYNIFVSANTVNEEYITTEIGHYKSSLTHCSVILQNKERQTVNEVNVIAEYWKVGNRFETSKATSIRVPVLLNSQIFQLFYFFSVLVAY